MTGRLSSTYGSRSERPAGRRSLLRALRRSWRVARWVGLAPALVGLWACTSRTLEQPKVLPNSVYQNKFVETREPGHRHLVRDRQLVVDGGVAGDPATRTSRGSWTCSRACRTVCRTCTSRVVSSDMGAGRDIAALLGNGDDTASSSLAERRRDLHRLDLRPGDVHRERQRHAELHRRHRDGVPCIANLGITGCGFEQHLASMARALGADDGCRPPAPGEPGLPPTRRLPRHHLHRQRGRLLGAGLGEQPALHHGCTNRIDSPSARWGASAATSSATLCGGMRAEPQRPERRRRRRRSTIRTASRTSRASS